MAPILGIHLSCEQRRAGIVLTAGILLHRDTKIKCIRMLLSPRAFAQDQASRDAVLLRQLLAET